MGLECRLDEFPCIFLTEAERVTSESKTPLSEPGTPSNLKTTMAPAETLIPNYMITLKSMFTFAFIWGFGGSLKDR